MKYEKLALPSSEDEFDFKQVEPKIPVKPAQAPAKSAMSEHFGPKMPIALGGFAPKEVV